MTIKQKREGNSLTLELSGRLDTTTAPQLEAELGRLDGVEMLTLDMSNMDYLSSAGLRVLLSAQKLMSKRSGMVVKNVCETIMEVFEVTGFSDILAIEN